MKKHLLHKTLFCTLALSLTLTFTACSADSADIEKEVEAALAENSEAAGLGEAEETEDPEPALEYIEVADPESDTQPENAMDVVEMEVSTADEQGNVESETESTDVYEKDGILQIVFLGDSIFDAVRDETGIAHLVGEELDADVYNLAIGGTTAGLRKDKNTDFDNWNEPNLMGVIYTMEGKITNGLLDDYKSGEVMSTLNPKLTNIFIIEYGTNDFLWYIPLGTPESEVIHYQYFNNALEMAVDNIHENYPDAQIIMCTPYYEEYWSADKSRYIGDAHSVNNGYGTLLDYIGVVENVARKKDCTLLNMYDLMGIDQNNVNDMTVDGIHPSEAARRKYADILVDTIKEINSVENSDNEADLEMDN